jgi:hypothetical protein
LRRKWLNGNNERETQNVYLLISVWTQRFNISSVL